MADNESTKQDNAPEGPRFLTNPDKVDVFLLLMLFGIAIYGFAMIPLRGWLLSNPMEYSLLVGGYTSAVISGANVSIGEGHPLVYLAAALFGALKFMPFYWWMGRRWGHDFIDLSVQYTSHLQKFLSRALGSESKKSTAWCFGLLPLGFLPGPIPGNIINALLGALRSPVVLVMLVNAVSVVVINGAMMWLGYSQGEAVLSIVNLVNRYLLWVTLALLAVVFWRAWRQAKNRPKVAELESEHGSGGAEGPAAASGTASDDGADKTSN